MEEIFMRNRILIAIIILLTGWVIFDFVTGGSKEEAISEVVQEEITKGTYDTQTKTGSQPKQLNIKKGDQAPDFQLNTTDGETINLSDFHGQKVLLNFWATWCPPCRKEMPDMQAYHKENEDVAILAVNLTESERMVEDVENFLDEFGVTFTVLLDESTEVANLYTAHALPTSYFIDSQGVVQEKVMGGIDYDFIENQFKKMK